MNLSELPKNTQAIVKDVTDRQEVDPIARRLRELGFAAGAKVVVRAYGPVMRDPIMVHIGDARFALRKTEAARVTVEVLA